MTQSGQGDEPQLPAARPAHEGVVLPADGSGPVLPGTYADPAGVPAEGSPWGQPWGPESAQAQAHGQAQAQAQAPSQPQGWGQQPGQGWGQAPQPPAQSPVQQPPGQSPVQGYAPEQPVQQGYAPEQPAPQGYALPPQQPVAGSLPPLQAPAPLPPVQQPVAPLPPAGADAEATQLIPPVGHPAHPGNASHPGNSPYAGDSGHAAPYGQSAQGAQLPGALPPEAPADSTQFLGRVQPQPPQQQAQPRVDPDVEATQYIAPVPSQPAGAPFGIRPGAPGDRQPPAEFDSLFRSEPAASAPDSTQQMPRFQDAPPQQPYVTHRDPAPYDDGDDRGGRRRSGSKVPLLAALGVGIVVIGVGAGALLGLGGGGDDKGDDPQPASATQDGGAKPSPSADPVKEQAVALDKLLADSNNSRASVISSVENIKKCANLPQAATDLRAAADQRGDLVTRLGELSVDKLPRHAELTQALNKAWKASASADNHYAAWADQVAGKKGCHKGTARTTPQTGAGNRASGDASKFKQQAVPLWNDIARAHGLKTRVQTEL